MAGAIGTHEVVSSGAQGHPSSRIMQNQQLRDQGRFGKRRKHSGPCPSLPLPLAMPVMVHPGEFPLATRAPPLGYRAEKLCQELMNFWRAAPWVG